MSTVSELKKDIITRIQASDDLDFLGAIRTILFQREAPEFPLSEEQIKSIEAGLADIDAGRTVLHEEVMANLNSWLSEK